METGQLNSDDRLWRGRIHLVVESTFAACISMTLTHRMDMCFQFRVNQYAEYVAFHGEKAVIGRTSGPLLQLCVNYGRE